MSEVKRKWTTHFKRCIDDITLRTQEEQRTAIEEEEEKEEQQLQYIILQARRIQQ